MTQSHGAEPSRAATDETGNAAGRVSHHSLDATAFRDGFRKERGRGAPFTLEPTKSAVGVRNSVVNDQFQRDHLTACERSCRSDPATDEVRRLARCFGPGSRSFAKHPREHRHSRPGEVTRRMGVHLATAVVAASVPPWPDACGAAPVGAPPWWSHGAPDFLVRP
jgi:hypothetical protein